MENWDSDRSCAGHHYAVSGYPAGDQVVERSERSPDFLNGVSDPAGRFGIPSNTDYGERNRVRDGSLKRALRGWSDTRSRYGSGGHGRPPRPGDHRPGVEAPAAGSNGARIPRSERRKLRP